MQADIILARTSAKPASMRTADVSGTWLNELGSTMDITVSGASLGGKYESAVGQGGARKGSLTGFVNGELVSFTVLWPTAAITAWVGRHLVLDGQEAIETLWQMTTMGDDGDAGLWHSIYAGRDLFRRGA